MLVFLPSPSLSLPTHALREGVPSAPDQTFPTKVITQSLARILKVPFAIADATTLTEAGYVGDDVENILLRRT